MKQNSALTVLKVFGPKETSPFQIGQYEYDCMDLFDSNITSTPEYVNRLDFISCEIQCENENANIDEHIALYECVKTQAAAKLKVIPAEIFCVME